METNKEDEKMEESIYEDLSKGIRCKLCGNTYHKKTKKGFLVYHRAQHFGFKKGKTKPHKCNLCDEAYKSNNGLDRHMLKKHGVPIPKPHQCPHCDQAFIRKKMCSKHIKTHKSNNVSRMTPFHTVWSKPNNPVNNMNDHKMGPHQSKNQINTLKGQQMVSPQTNNPTLETPSKNHKIDPHQFVNSVFKLNQLHPGLEYKTNQEGGPTHAPIFCSTVELNGQIFKGTGRSKKQAKQAAAEAIFTAGLA